MSEAPPPMASPPSKKAPPSEADLLDNSTEKSPQTNSSKTDDQSPPPSSPSSSPPPSSPPPSPPTSPPPSSPPPSSPPLSPTPPAPDAPPPKPPASSPPPSSPPPSTSPPQPQTPPPPSSSPPPTNSPPLLPSPPPPLLSPPAIVSPPGTPAVFSPPPPLLPPPPKAASQTPVSVTPPPPPRTVQPPRSSNQGLSIGPGPSSSDSNIHGVIIAGITLGSVVIVALCIVIVCLICTKRKNKKPQYYMDPGGRPPKGAEQYYNNETPQWQNPRPNQNILLPPPPGYMGGWGAPPTPAPPGSGDYSGVYSSGVHPSPTPPSPPNMGGITHFSHEELASATSGFSQVNLLGQGGFGYVHKGVLGDKRVVAVKSLKSGSGQGEREFQAEVEIISRVHHRHLVSLVGYCIANQQRMLVYEFVPNSTLEFHLHGKGQPVVDWSTRIRIAVGSAKGLAYLHEDCMPRIIHRDIKAANILLDNNFEAMVADFGLAKLTSDNFTHVSTRVMGTFGYLAPEYASSGKLTEKSDVFSYGVMLLELITGRRPVDTTNRYMEDSLVDWARPLLTKALEDGNYQQLVDPRLEGNYTPHEMARMATCAAAAIRHSARRRPKMSQIVRALEGESSLEDLNEGVKPGQSSVYNPTGGAGAYDTRAYNADMLKFKQMVMSNTTDFNSSEYGATLSSSSSSSSSTATDHDQRHH